MILRTVASGLPGVLAREFELGVDDRVVPAIVWSPENGGPSPRPLVLVGHGGSGHKSSSLVLDVVRMLVSKHRFHVAAIDGPVHGARRAVFDEGVSVRDEFRAAWAAGGTIDPMVKDWRATIDALGKLAGVNRYAMGWYGISMGTAYGIPLVAAEIHIRAAVLGMWGTGRAGDDRLLADSANIRCPVLFQVKSEDEVFPAAGQAELYAAIASPAKEFRSYPGTHTNPAGAQLDDIVEFLSVQLRAAHGVYLD